jgi:hypothetical protein
LGLRFIIAVFNPLKFGSKAIHLFISRFAVDNTLFYQFSDTYHLHHTHPEADHFLHPDSNTILMIV